MHTDQGARIPALDEHSGKQTQPKVFEWYHNEVEAGLRRVYKIDIAQRDKIIGIMSDMIDSEMFWKLLSNYDAVMEDKSVDEEDKKDALIAFAARVYIAGTTRTAVVLSD